MFFLFQRDEYNLLLYDGFLGLFFMRTIVILREVREEDRQDTTSGLFQRVAAIYLRKVYRYYGRTIALRYMASYDLMRGFRIQPTLWKSITFISCTNWFRLYYQNMHIASPFSTLHKFIQIPATSKYLRLSHLYQLKKMSTVYPKLIEQNSIF